uniref:Uncharacterized protein n=1 Tax=Arundo donax TaxID=35708 RepID=A0A0A8XTT7_ARUDO
MNEPKKKEEVKTKPVSTAGNVIRLRRQLKLMNEPKGKKI